VPLEGKGGRKPVERIVLEMCLIKSERTPSLKNPSEGKKQEGREKLAIYKSRDF